MHGGPQLVYAAVSEQNEPTNTPKEIAIYLTRNFYKKMLRNFNAKFPFSNSTFSFSQTI